MLKIFGLLFCSAALVICSGCASSTGQHHPYAAHAGASSDNLLGGTSQSAPSTAATDYLNVLSDPGPF